MKTISTAIASALCLFAAAAAMAAPKTNKGRKQNQ